MGFGGDSHFALAAWEREDNIEIGAVFGSVESLTGHARACPAHPHQEEALDRRDKPGDDEREVVRHDRNTL
jgi:hypothetical protein